MSNSRENPPLTIDQKISDTQIMQLFALAHQEGALFSSLATVAEQQDTAGGEEKFAVRLDPSVKIVFDAWMQQFIESGNDDPYFVFNQKTTQLAEILVGTKKDTETSSQDIFAKYQEVLQDFFVDEYGRRREALGFEGDLKVAS